MMRTRRSMIIAAAGVSTALLLCSASADVIVLSDATLLAFGDVGGTAASTLDDTVDIAGDPGVQYGITWANQPGWTDIALGQYSPSGIGLGDTVQATVKNLDPVFPTYARIYMQVDSGWSYSQGTGFWIPAGGAEQVLTHVNPATSEVKAVGIKIGTDGWTERPPGSSVTVQVVPEPSALVLLGIGSALLALWRRRR